MKRLISNRLATLLLVVAALAMVCAYGCNRNPVDTTGETKNIPTLNTPENPFTSDDQSNTETISADSVNVLGRAAMLSEKGDSRMQTAAGWQLYVSVPYFSQVDPAWSGQRLGYNTSYAYTLGSHGCAVTCLAMLYGKWGYGASPSTINNWAHAGKSHYAFVAGDGNIRFPQCLEYPGYICRSYQNISYNDIYPQLQKGRPVIVEIAYGSGSHFMVIFGFDGTRYWVKDPLRTSSSPDTPLYGSVRSVRLWGYTK